MIDLSVVLLAALLSATMIAWQAKTIRAQSKTIAKLVVAVREMRDHARLAETIAAQQEAAGTPFSGWVTARLEDVLKAVEAKDQA